MANVQTLYKLTDQNMQTYGKYQWALNEKRTTNGKGDLCGPGFLHAYTHPLLAVLLNPIHANIKRPRLFRCRGIVGKTDHGLKVGCTSLTLIEELPVPAITTTQRVAFGVLCAKKVCKDKSWTAWADAWLSGEDRSVTAARAAAARMAAWAGAAEWAAAKAAGWSARAAARMADFDLIGMAKQAVAKY